MNIVEKTNVLFVLNGFGIGGGELKVLELVKCLNHQKFNITVVSVGMGGPLEEKFQALKIPVYILSRSWRYDLSLPAKLARIARSKNIDIISSTLFYADIISALATYYYRPKALVSWEVITGQLEFHQKLMYKLLAGRFDKVVAVSNSIHPFIINVRKTKPERIQTIYYGVDTAKFVPKATRKKNKNIVFGTVARLVHQKGHEYLLQAIPSVLEKHPNVEWHFVGSGYKEKELKSKVRQLGIESRVKFWGQQSNIADFLYSFDVFVLPSLWEGFPNVVLEAMACGKPVIATDVEGTRELVVDQVTGKLIPKKSSEMLAQAMIQVLDNHELLQLYGKNGRKRVEEKFTLQQQINAFESLFENMLL